jgi:hypothetical protein
VIAAVEECGDREEMRSLEVYRKKRHPGLNGHCAYRSPVRGVTM